MTVEDVSFIKGGSSAAGSLRHYLMNPRGEHSAGTLMSYLGKRDERIIKNGLKTIYDMRGVATLGTFVISPFYFLRMAEQITLAFVFGSFRGWRQASLPRFFP